MNQEEQILKILLNMQSDLTDMKADIAELKTDVAGLKADVAELKTDVAGLKADVAELKVRTTALEQGQEELRSILTRFEQEQTSKTNALFDAFELRGDQIERFKVDFGVKFDEMHADMTYGISKIAQHEKKIYQLEQQVTSLIG